MRTCSVVSFHFIVLCWPYTKQLIKALSQKEKKEKEKSFIGVPASTCFLFSLVEDLLFHLDVSIKTQHVKC